MASSALIQKSRFDVDAHAVQRLAGLAGDHAGDALARADDLLGLDGDVAGLAAGTTGGLVDHEARVGQRQAAPWARPGRWGAGAGHPAGADRGDRARTKRIMSWMASPLDVAAGAGDQQGDGRIALLAQREQAAAGSQRHLVVDPPNTITKRDLKSNCSSCFSGRPSWRPCRRRRRGGGVRHGVGAVKAQSAALLGVR